MSSIIVIQCAAEKDGGYLRTSAGEQVALVAQPRLASLRSGWIFAHPDDQSPSGYTWRDVLAGYNERFMRSGENTDNLRPAWQLYANRVYRDLAHAFGTDNLYILSAGWGLVQACYLLPNYDITFSNQADTVNVRRKGDQFRDAIQMPSDVIGPGQFVGGLSYLPLFCELTDHVRAERIVYYNSQRLPDARGCRAVPYRTRTRTNWHYECARDLIAHRAVMG